MYFFSKRSIIKTIIFKKQKLSSKQVFQDQMNKVQMNKIIISNTLYSVSVEELDWSA